MRRRINKHQRHDDQSRDLKHAQELATRHNSNRQKCEQETARQSTKLLKCLNSCNCGLNDLLSLGRRHAAIDLNKRRHYLRKLLDRAERCPKAARKDQCADQSSPPILRSEDLSKARTLECSSQFFLFPHRRLG